MDRLDCVRVVCPVLSIHWPTVTVAVNVYCVLETFARTAQRDHRHHRSYDNASYRAKGGSSGRAGGSMPPPVISVCNNFYAWLLAFRHTTQLTSKRFVNRIMLKVSELPHLSLTLTLAQPRCNCKCNLTLTLDSRYNRRHALAWEYQR